MCGVQFRSSVPATHDDENQSWLTEDKIAALWTVVALLLAPHDLRPKPLIPEP